MPLKIKKEITVLMTAAIMVICLPVWASDNPTTTQNRSGEIPYSGDPDRPRPPYNRSDGTIVKSTSVSYYGTKPLRAEDADPGPDVSQPPVQGDYRDSTIA